VVPRDQEAGGTSPPIVTLEDTNCTAVVIVFENLALIRTGCIPTTYEEVVRADTIGVEIAGVVAKARAINA